MSNDAFHHYLRPAGDDFTIRDLDPEGPEEADRVRLEEESEQDLTRLEELTYLMYAENRRSLLVILQGIDASGKNSTTKHIARGINPDALKVWSFKAPCGEELDHDYFWRIHRVAPPRGDAAIFNRSHYEEVITVRVHPELLEKQQLPESTTSDPALFTHRYRQINDFERILSENGTTIVKFFLHISKEEQLKNFRQRVESRHKNWKFSRQDIEERTFWDEYQKAFQEMIRATSTSWAPWHAVPADRKWFRNWMVGRVLVDRLDGLKMHYPPLEEEIDVEDLQ